MPWTEWLKALIPIFAAVIGSVGAFVGAGIAAALAIKAYRTNQWWDTRNKVYQEIVATIDLCYSACIEYHLRLKRENEFKSRCSDGRNYEGMPSYISDEKNESLDKFFNLWKKVQDLASQNRFIISKKSRDVLKDAIADCYTIITPSEKLLTDLEPSFKFGERLYRCLNLFGEVSKCDLSVVPQIFYLRILWLKIEREYLTLADSIHLLALVIWLGESKGRASFVRKDRLKNYMIACDKIREEFF